MRFRIFILYRGHSARECDGHHKKVVSFLPITPARFGQPITTKGVKLARERSGAAKSHPAIGTRDKTMNDWLHNLPVVWMALLVFGPYISDRGSNLCSHTVPPPVGEASTPRFKGSLAGLLPPLGIIFGLFRCVHRGPGLDRQRKGQDGKSIAKASAPEKRRDFWPIASLESPKFSTSRV